jgi:hypothetical protein
LTVSGLILHSAILKPSTRQQAPMQATWCSYRQAAPAEEALWLTPDVTKDSVDKIIYL